MFCKAQENEVSQTCYCSMFLEGKVGVYTIHILHGYYKNNYNIYDKVQSIFRFLGESVSVQQCVELELYFDVNGVDKIIETTGYHNNSPHVAVVLCWHIGYQPS